MAAPRAWAELAADTDEISRQRRDAAHVALLERLPGLLMETTAVAHERSGHDRELLFGLLAVQLFAAHSVTHKTGYEDLSAVVEDRISWATEHSGDPLMMTLAPWARTTSMLTVGAYDIGRDLLTRVQDGLPEGRNEAAALGVAGPLHLHTARTLAPQQTRRHPTTREVVRMLLRAHQRSNEPLARFADGVDTQP